jgi:hypothetical protein
MKARLPIALLALTLAFGCSKKKAPQTSPEEQRQKVAQYILDKAPDLPNKLDTVIGDKMKLLGYQLEPSGPYKQGQKLKLTLDWQPTGKIEAGYKLFTQILDGSGERLLTIDRNAPLRPTKKDKSSGLPIQVWETSKVYKDVQTFHVPKTKSDTIQFVTGIGKKEGPLPVTAGAKDSSDRAIVGSIQVSGGDKSSPKATKLPAVDVEKLETGTKINVDGKLDEPAWATAAVLGPFIDVSNGKEAPGSPVHGSAKLLWNDTNLYVAFEVQDANITGGFPKGAKDPHLWTKDTVEMMIDPDGDGDNADYYEIQIGPQNLVFDSQYDQYNEPKTEPDGPFGHEDWSSKLKSAVVLDGTIDKPEDTDKGYTVEAAIPWKSFAKAKKTPPALGDTWRMNFYAMQDNGGVGWSPLLGQGNFHKAARFGKVRFTAKGWTPPVEAVDGGAPTPAASGSAAPAPSGSAAVATTPGTPLPKGVASTLKPPGARPAQTPPGQTQPPP